MSDNLQAKLFGEDKKPSAHAGEVVSVLVPFPVDKAYDYAVPQGMNVQAGDYVSVPLGGRIVAGVVWGGAAGDVPRAKLKTIAYKYDDMPSLPAIHRQFLDWVAQYTLKSARRGFENVACERKDVRTRENS